MGRPFRAVRVALDRLVRQLGSMHACKQFPVERFGRYSVQWNRFHPVGIMIGDHAPDDAVRLFHETADRLQARCCAIILSSGVGGAPRKVCPRIVAFVAEASEYWPEGSLRGGQEAMVWAT